MREDASSARPPGVARGKTVASNLLATKIKKFKIIFSYDNNNYLKR